MYGKEVLICTSAKTFCRWLPTQRSLKRSYKDFTSVRRCSEINLNRFLMDRVSKYEHQKTIKPVVHSAMLIRQCLETNDVVA